MRPCKPNKTGGFSYLFTLFFVAILGVGLVVAAQVYTTAVQRDKEKELLFIGQQFSEAIGRYYAANKNNPVNVISNNAAPVQRTQGLKIDTLEDSTVIQKGAVINNRYPKEIEDLLLDRRSLELTRYLRKVFVDPMTGKPEWGVKRVGGRIVGVYSLSDQTPIKQVFFEDEPVQFNGKSRYRDWVFTYPTNLKFDTSASVNAADIDE